MPLSPQCIPTVPSSRKCGGLPPVIDAQTMRGGALTSQTPHPPREALSANLRIMPHSTTSPSALLKTRPGSAASEAVGLSEHGICEPRLRRANGCIKSARFQESRGLIRQLAYLRFGHEGGSLAPLGVGILTRVHFTNTTGEGRRTATSSERRRQDGTRVCQSKPIRVHGDIDARHTRDGEQRGAWVDLEDS